MKKQLPIALLLFLMTISGFSQSISDNLIAHYDFANGSVSDLSGNNNNAINVGATVTTGIEEIPDQALSLSSGNYISLPSGMFLKANLSISVWFKTSTSGALIGYQNAARTATPGQYVPIAYLGSDNELKAGFWTGDKRNVNGNTVNYANNKWHHLVVTVASGSQTVYVDGVLTGSSTLGHTILTGMTSNQIGTAYTKGWNSGASGWLNFVGSIDNLRVYDVTINATVVKDIYDEEVRGGIPPNELIADYSFNNGAMTDASVYARDATNSGATFTTDRFGNIDRAVALDGSSHITLPSGILLENTISVSLWFKTTQSGSILGYQNTDVDATPGQYVPIAFVRQDDKFSSSFWSPAGKDGNIDTSTIKYTDGTWHHMVLTATNSSQNIYMDNVLTGTSTNGHSVLSGMTYSQIGTAYTDRWNGTNNNWFDFTGSVDDVKIYSTELTPTRVDSLFNAPNPETITGIFNNYKKEKLSIYPNPATSIIYTEVGGLDIFDALGNQVLSTESTGTVNVANLESGIYIVNQSNKKTKLIIE